MAAVVTPNQTVGPYFRIGMAHLYIADIPGDGERMGIQGRVVDGDGAPVDDAILEIWQADAHGKYAAASTDGAGRPTGFGRVATDAAGAFRFTTIKPGRVAGPNGTLQAPHLAVAVFMRGLLRHLLTRVYFPDEPSNSEDRILQQVPTERRATLVARKIERDPRALEWNVMLQGPDETVFFEY
jgi:protocatechuate 3,4-dioxygenase alpha subunit